MKRAERQHRVAAIVISSQLNHSETAFDALVFKNTNLHNDLSSSASRNDERRNNMAKSLEERLSESEKRIAFKRGKGRGTIVHLYYRDCPKKMKQNKKRYAFLFHALMSCVFTVTGIVQLVCRMRQFLLLYPTFFSLRYLYKVPCFSGHSSVQFL